MHVVVEGMCGDLEQHARMLGSHIESFICLLTAGHHISGLSHLHLSIHLLSLSSHSHLKAWTTKATASLELADSDGYVLSSSRGQSRKTGKLLHLKDGESGMHKAVRRYLSLPRQRYLSLQS